jgi:hypothetical protein
VSECVCGGGGGSHSVSHSVTHSRASGEWSECCHLNAYMCVKIHILCAVLCCAVLR